jgi:YVTN family beta-propeller protein
MRVGVVLLVACIATACSAPPAGGPSETIAPVTLSSTVTSVPVPTPAALVAPVAAQASPTPAAPRYRTLRVFVTSDMGESVFVLEGGAQFAVVGEIAVGKMPHNIAVSPDGRWVATANRMANNVSIIDPYAMKEVARVGVGHQPHDLTWSLDSKTLFVGHERDTFIARVEAGTWKSLSPLVVGVPQHDLALSASRPNEVYFTVTNSMESDHLRVFDLLTNQITKFKVQDVHDVFFLPDSSELWTTSSGYVGVPSDRMVASDPATHAMKTEFHFAGRYPFHTMKPGRDGLFYPPAGTPMLLTDHLGPSLLWVDAKERRIVGETKIGPEPYHSTYDPLGDRVLVTSNKDGNVWVIDRITRQVVQTVAVHAAHGIVAVGLP